MMKSMLSGIWRIYRLSQENISMRLQSPQKKQFTILKKLMDDKDIDIVINACDAGREGEAIFRLVYNQANCKKKMKRLWISSMEDSAIKEGFDNLKDGSSYDNLLSLHKQGRLQIGLWE